MHFFGRKSTAGKPELQTKPSYVSPLRTLRGYPYGDGFVEMVSIYFEGEKVAEFEEEDSPYHISAGEAAYEALAIHSKLAAATLQGMESVPTLYDQQWRDFLNDCEQYFKLLRQARALPVGDVLAALATLERTPLEQLALRAQALSKMVHEVAEALRDHSELYSFLDSVREFELLAADENVIAAQEELHKVYLERYKSLA